jgi:protein-L-isoaspartate(D-aspartate) O-methyltransferase
MSPAPSERDAPATLETARQQMIHQQVRAWEVLDERVLRLFERVPRERFVPDAYRGTAFADTGIPLGAGDRMLAPKVVGRILQALDIAAADRVLEVGTGSGFLTACLSLQAATVTTVERRSDLAAAARERLQQFGAQDVSVLHGDVYAPHTLPADARFNVIVLTGSLPVPDDSFQQRLTLGGRLFAVVGEAPAMEARLIRRVAERSFATESLFETQLVPLVGARRGPLFKF